MLIPRLSFGKLVHISSSLMTLLLAMNMHSLAGHLKDDGAQKSGQPMMNQAQAADGAEAEAPPATPVAAETPRITTPQHARTKDDRNALEGWVSLLQPDGTGGEGTPPAPAAADPALTKPAGVSGDCSQGISCTSIKSDSASLASDTDPDVSKAEADLVKDILARRSDVDNEEKDLSEQKHVLNAAQTALDEKMHDLDASMAILAQKQAAHREAMLADTDRLVKIYEDMPPKEAAAVFNIMDIHVLVAIANQMNPRKISAIMGSMTPERVNLVSQFLAGVRSFRPVHASAVSDDRPALQGMEMGALTSYSATTQRVPAQGPLKPSRQ